MSSFSAAALVIGLLVVIGVPALWWVFNSGPPSPAERKMANERFRKRQSNPDYEAFRRQFGIEPPKSLKELYADPSIFAADKDMFEVVLPTGAAGTRWCVAWIEPLDHEHFSSRHWPGTEGYYSFANDGSGDQYLIDPKQSDPEVLYYEHETGIKKSVGATLSQFMSAQRLYDKDEE